MMPWQGEQLVPLRWMSPSMAKRMSPPQEPQQAWWKLLVTWWPGATQSEDRTLPLVPSYLSGARALILWYSNGKSWNITRWIGKQRLTVNHLEISINQPFSSVSHSEINNGIPRVFSPSRVFWAHGRMYILMELLKNSPYSQRLTLTDLVHSPRHLLSLSESMLLSWRKYAPLTQPNCVWFRALLWKAAVKLACSFSLEALTHPRWQLLFLLFLDPFS